MREVQFVEFQYYLVLLKEEFSTNTDLHTISFQYYLVLLKGIKHHIIQI